MVISRKPRRVALIGVALALIAANVWWFSRDAPPSVPEFEIGASGAQVVIPESDRAGLPRFDAAASSWTVAGTRISDISTHVRRDARIRQAGAPGADRFVVVAMEAGASADEMRRMLLALTKAGVCEVAVVQDGDPLAAPGSSLAGAAYQVDIQRIIAVRGNDGDRLACVPKIADQA